MKLSDIEDHQLTFVPCTSCNGIGTVECCDGHMCPGYRTCHRCYGMGKLLSEADAKLKEILKQLMEYK